MNHTRTGKIARLPVEVREVLGDRLAASEPAATLVNWLNGLVSVQEVLQQYFGSRLITEQNLSEWRQGGHQDWLRQEQARFLIEDLAQQDKNLSWAARGQAVSDRLASRVTLELFQLAETLVAAETDPLQRWERLCQVHAQLARQRQHDHRAEQLQLEHQRLEFQVARARGEQYHLPEPGEGKIRTSPSTSQFGLNCLESLTKDSQDRTLPQYRKPFVPVLEPDPAATPDPEPKAQSPEPPSNPIQPNPTKSNPTAKNSARRTKPRASSLKDPVHPRPPASAPASGVGPACPHHPATPDLPASHPQPSDLHSIPQTPDARPQSLAPPSTPVQSSPGQSNLVQPNQGQSNLSAGVETTCPHEAATPNSPIIHETSGEPSEPLLPSQSSVSALHPAPQAPSQPPPPVPSPCLGLCKFNGGGFCTGCFRNTAEIVRWPTMADVEKAFVVATCAKRKASQVPTRQMAKAG
jgi:predicted Fe-S protein YdhL (DUF1289 family)